MRWRIGKIGRTELWLHGAALCFWGYMLLAGQGLLLAVGLVSIALHEGAHALMAALLHAAPQMAELTPLGLLLRLEEEDALPAGKRALILLAGPVMTALLALLGWYGTRWGWLAPDVGARLFFGNLSLLLMNLLPALPLDGGRLLALALSRWMDLAAQLHVMRALGMALGAGAAVLAVVCGLWQGAFNLSLAMIGCFLMYAAQTATATEAMAALRQFLYRRSRLETRGVLPGEILAVLARQPLRQVLPHLGQERYTCLAILESGTLRVLGMADEDMLQQTYLSHPDGVCADLLPQEVPHGKTPRKQPVDK